MVAVWIIVIANESFSLRVPGVRTCTSQTFLQRPERLRWRWAEPPRAFHKGLKSLGYRVLAPTYNPTHTHSILINQNF